MKILQILNTSFLTEDSADPFAESELSPSDNLAAIKRKIEAFAHHESQAFKKLVDIFNTVNYINPSLVVSSADKPINAIPIKCYNTYYMIIAPETEKYVKPLHILNAMFIKATQGGTKFKRMLKSIKAQATKVAKRDLAATPKVTIDPATIPKTIKLTDYTAVSNPYFRSTFDLYAGSAGHFNYGKFQKQFVFLDRILRTRGYGGFKTTYASSHDAGGQPTFLATTADGKINWYVRSRKGQMESTLYPMDLHVTKVMTMLPAVLDQRLPVVKSKP